MRAKRREYLVFLAFCVLAIVSLFAYFYTSAQRPLSTYYSQGQISVSNASCTSCSPVNETVWLAYTPEQQAVGMMNRQNFEGAQGMLFAYTSQQPLCFWMENTMIPLKQVWINATGYVTSVYDAKPYNTTSVCSQGIDVLEVPVNSSISLGYRIKI